MEKKTPGYFWVIKWNILHHKTCLPHSCAGLKVLFVTLEDSASKTLAIMFICSLVLNMAFCWKIHFNMGEQMVTYCLWKQFPEFHSHLAYWFNFRGFKRTKSENTIIWLWLLFLYLGIMNLKYTIINNNIWNVAIIMFYNNAYFLLK